MASLTKEQIARKWVERGGDPKYANLMAAISIRESGGKEGTNNRGLNKNGTVDWGPYQVNDIWRKDPVIGKLFKSGAILTIDGATDAAIRILKVQGPKAWATYNGATDSKYLGGFKGGPVKMAAPPTIGTTTDRKPAAQGAGVEGAILDSFLSGGKRHGSLFDEINGRLASGNYASPMQAIAPATKAAPPMSGGSAGASLGQQAGNYTINPGANRKGVNLKPYLLDFASKMAGLGSFAIGTGTNHNQMTTTGNVSDHWDGSAMDIPATGKRGDQIAYQAFRTAGVPEKKARLWAANGGVYNVELNGTRVQILWKTNVGGNHYNHVHVGLRPGK